MTMMTKLQFATALLSGKKLHNINSTRYSFIHLCGNKIVNENGEKLDPDHDYNYIEEDEWEEYNWMSVRDVRPGQKFDFNGVVFTRIKPFHTSIHYCAINSNYEQVYFDWDTLVKLQE